jgi:hyperosmotically inducible periplasmic protein
LQEIAGGRLYATAQLLNPNSKRRRLMKRILIVLLSLVVSSNAIAAQNSNSKTTKKPKAEKAAPVDCGTVDDATITANVKSKLSNTPSLKDATINVDTKGGVVTLTGMVKMGRNKGLATLQSKRVACVKKVENQLSVEQSKDETTKNKN